MHLQTTVYSIVIITVFLAVVLVIINRKLRKFDPLSKPKGIVLLIMMATETIDKLVKEKTNDKAAGFLTPYMMTIILYVFVSNVAGLFSLDTPTSNYSVTLVLAALTCILIEYYSQQAKGTKQYIKSWFEPFAPFVVLNILSKFSTLLSLSLRLFGNILSGGILMSVIYQMLARVSALIPVIGKFNIIGVIVAPVLHFYFDLFSGAMQAYIFVILSLSFISKELPDDK